MAAIQLDLNKLLGFKIIAKEVNLRPPQVSIGAKLGSKPGDKNVIRIGAKIGDKTGDKNPG